MNAPTPSAWARRLVTTAAVTVALGGAGVALPAVAGAATPAPRTTSPAPGAPARAPSAATPVPAPSTTVPTPAAAAPGPSGPPSVVRVGPDGQVTVVAPGEAGPPTQPRGGVDTGLGGSQLAADDGTGAAAPLAATGAGLVALAGFGGWRRRRRAAARG
ncbi:hypothetical protein [Frankia nepalensis]|uniref:hypothetical protein n=1 Tax=Frankia nepalensis TaxID=1836974 RepID=UPI001933EEF7|nr:hypothetical protein [Frankia nepalensis]MBL7510856.1 hypothetical protein [Frankia nepalensis]